jgi:imidazolonepropionase
MPEHALFIRNASRVLTLASPGAPKRGGDLGELGEVADGAVLVRGERIEAVGPTEEVERALGAEDVEVIDAGGGLVAPGFVDPHTHLLFAGSRAEEFEARLVHGADYLSFVQAGAGGLSTVAATRATSTVALAALVRRRLERMLAAGTTTAEVKTGYGLTVEDELRHLRALRTASKEVPLDVAPTLLAAHFRPPEYRDDPGPWLAQIESDLLPTVARDELATAADVFCEPGIYSVDQARKLLKAARREGLAVHLHADQLSDSEGAALAAEIGALSADHLGHVSTSSVRTLAASATVAVLIPGSAFFVPGERVPPARQMVEQGVAIAIASDCNPGTSPMWSQSLAIGLSVVLFKLSVAEAIAAATINAAHAIGRGRDVGSLEPGKLADLVILEADDYRDVAYRFGQDLVRTVIKRGRVVGSSPGIGPL